MPTPSKAQSDLDPSPLAWCREGEHPSLFDACQEPLTASAIARRRESKVMKASENGKPEPRAPEMDLYAVIARQGFKNTVDDHTAAERLIAWLKAHGTLGLSAFAFKNRAKLRSLIDDVWKWETVDSFLADHGVPVSNVFWLLRARLAAAAASGAQWRSWRSI